MPPRRKGTKKSTKKSTMPEDTAAHDPNTIIDKTCFKAVEKGFPKGLALEGPFSFPNSPLTLRELTCMLLSSIIREKPNWTEKVNNAAITAKWKEESLAQADELPSGDLTDAMWTYILDEVKWLASQIGSDGIQPAVDNTYRTDSIPIEAPELREEIMALAHKLETEQPLDWHPGSEGKVLDLLHPSLFPLHYGTTKILDPVDRPLANAPCMPHCGGGKVVTVPAYASNTGIYQLRKWSKDFQWLPADFKVNADGSVSIQSYINNLHPIQYAPFYKSIARLFEKFVPLFENVLRSLLYPRPDRVKQVDPYNWYENEPDVDYELSDEEELAAQEEAHEEWYENREPVVPDVAPFDPADMEPWNIAPPGQSDSSSGEDRFNNRTWRRIKKNKDTNNAMPSYKLSEYDRIQVIVKMADIRLTPHSEYGGGTWHLEGQLNESIVATGIYYYDSENIKGSKLDFRRACDEVSYEQGDDKGVSTVYGLENEENSSQEIGSINTICGRAIAFPNVYQHKVAPFELEDATKPGHRKIIAFFLVDPNRNAISTSTVPPQQRSWWVSGLRQVPRFSSLPGEIFDMIVKNVDYPLSFEDACKTRIELMDERSSFTVNHNEYTFEQKFSLCEH